MVVSSSVTKCNNTQFLPLKVPKLVYGRSDFFRCDKGYFLSGVDSLVGVVSERAMEASSGILVIDWGLSLSLDDTIVGCRGFGESGNLRGDFEGEEGSTPYHI